MTNNKPLVSIIIPCYNHENYIQNSIQSVIDQDYKNIELIIIDDGSTDRSVDKIKEMSTYCEKRFENYVFIHRANKGVSATLNQGLSIAQGKYVSFCSSDDSYHPEKVSRQMLFLQSNPKLNCCYTLICFVDEYSNIIESETELVNSKLNVSISFEDILKFKINLPITGMFITKYIRDKLGGFDETLSAEDYDMNLKVAQESKICFVKDRLYNTYLQGLIGS
nr:glycosyltransferase family A protein [Pseudoalteromonas sp. WY3]